LPRDAIAPSRAGPCRAIGRRRPLHFSVPCPGGESLWGKQDHCLVDLLWRTKARVKLPMQVAARWFSPSGPFRPLAEDVVLASHPIGDLCGQREEGEAPSWPCWPRRHRDWWCFAKYMQSCFSPNLPGRLPNRDSTPPFLPADLPRGPSPYPTGLAALVNADRSDGHLRDRGTRCRPIIEQATRGGESPR